MFQKTVVVDFTGMNDWAKDQLRALSREVVFYDDFPKDILHFYRAKGSDSDPHHATGDGNCY